MLEIIFAPAARREIKKFDKQIQTRFIRALELLAVNPRPSGAEKIKGHTEFYRIKAGADHRVNYHIRNEQIVVVLVLRDRKEAYRSLDDLDDKLKAALLEIAASARASRD